jgi:hypothetical protein
MKLLTPKFYCATNCDDIKFVFEHIKRKHQKSRIIATGLSLGGIVLCRYLVESGDDSLVDAAMLISVCFDLNAGFENITKPGLNKAFNQHLTRTLVDVIQDHKEAFKDVKEINFEEVIKSRTSDEFDERFTIKMWNFNSFREYYHEASNKGKLGNIKRPMLCISAADDVIVPVSCK